MDMIDKNRDGGTQGHGMFKIRAKGLGSDYRFGVANRGIFPEDKFLHGVTYSDKRICYA